MDHIEQSKGHESAFRGDVAYNFLNDSFFKQLKFGARYADREQDIKYTTYNWGSLSEIWGGASPQGGGAVFMNQVGAPGGNTQLFQWNNFFRGPANAPPPALYYNGSLTNGYQQAIDFANSVEAQSIAQGFSPSWVPLASRPCAVDGPFCPQDIQKVSQKTDNAYAMLRFGQDEPIFGNVKLDGNIGVRVVRDTLASGDNLVSSQPSSSAWLS